MPRATAPTVCHCSSVLLQCALLNLSCPLKKCQGWTRLSIFFPMLLCIEKSQWVASRGVGGSLSRCQARRGCCVKCNKMMVVAAAAAAAPDVDTTMLIRRLKMIQAPSLLLCSSPSSVADGSQARSNRWWNEHIVMSLPITSAHLVGSYHKLQETPGTRDTAAFLCFTTSSFKATDSLQP